MGSHGVRDKVAIVGMGCTRFAELWEKSLDDLIVDASTEAFTSAGVAKDDVDAYWFGTAQSGMSGITLARPLLVRLQFPRHQGQNFRTWHGPLCRKLMVPFVWRMPFCELQQHVMRQNGWLSTESASFRPCTP